MTTTAYTDIGRLITRDPAIRGGRPMVAGTGVTVQRIVGWYRLGLSPDKISTQVRHLSLAHELRWQLLQALAYSDRRVHELVELVDRPMNTVSYHLGQLRQHALAQEHRSAADARDVYSVDLDKLRHLYFAAGGAIHPSLDATEPEPSAGADTLSPTRILFLCTHNSARSQMAEAIARTCSKGRIESFSAGTEPGVVNPYAIRAMEAMGMDIRDQRSKHLDEFLGQNFHYVITVCDSAREACPVFPGDPARIHWSFPDPSAAEGSDAEKLRVFQETARQLTNRINHLLVLIDRKQRGA